MGTKLQSIKDQKSERLKDRRAKRKILWAKRDELQKRIAATTDESVKADLENEITFFGKWIQILDNKIREDMGK